MISKFASAILISTFLTSNLFAESVLIPIKSGADDAEEREDSSIYLDSSDLELTESGGIQTIGLRFTNIPIPAGAQINNAYVQFKVDEASSGESALTIAGESVSDAAPFSASTANISNRSLTTNQMNWSPSDWSSVGSRGADQQTPDLSAVLQEIVDSNDWVQGQAMVLVISGTGERVAESFEGDADGAPTLHVQFTPEDSENEPPDDRVKVAFVGDQGVNSNARSALSLIASEGTNLLLIQGDLGYDDNTAQQWETNLTDILGEDFPVLTVVGNHENFEWDVYQPFIANRIDRVPGLSNCSGEPGVKSFCQFQNLDIVQVAPGVSHSGIDPDDGYPQFITESFDSVSASQGNRWRICSWHKNQTNMQTGSKTNEVGWEAYDACLQAGALIATGHEHAYSRTYLLDNFESQSVVHTDSVMTLMPGNSIAFVSGLGGRGIRPQIRDGDWWASIYTSTQGANHGALFCEFGSTDADCYFKDIGGSVVDQFTLKLPVSEQDQDSDGDGVIDINDSFPLDPNETIDTDGDSIGNNADTDDDNDGVADSDDTFPLDSSESSDFDGDGIGDNADTDIDNDGFDNTVDAFPFDASEWLDSDGDGIGDNADDDNAGGSCNLLENGSLDTSTAGWATDTTLSIVTDAVAGGGAMSWGNGGASTVFSASANTNYVFTGFVKSPDTAGWAGLGIDFLDSAGNELTEVFQTTPPVADYAEITLNSSSPPGTVFARLWIFTQETRSIQVDELDLRAVDCTDGSGGSNQAPVIVEPGNQTYAVSDIVNLGIIATDSEGDNLQFTATGLPDGLQISATTGVVSGTPTIESDNFVVITVSDGTLQSSISFNWTIQSQGVSGNACNLLPNGDFEMGSDSWFSNAALTLTAEASTGERALRFTGGSTSTMFPVEDGMVYTFNASYKSEGSTEWSGFGIDYLDASGQELSEEVMTLQPSSIYTNASLSGTVPANATSIQLWFYTPTTRNLTLDNVQLRDVSCNL